MEKDTAYNFRKSLTTSNYPITIDMDKTFGEEYVSLKSGCVFSGESSIVIENAKKDFFDFLSVSLNVQTSENPVGIELNIAPEKLDDYKGYKGRKIVVCPDKIIIYANDERGIASAIFDLEILIKREKAPYVKIGEYKNKPLFSPRMTHSAFDMDTFPDGYLLNLAKEGIDAIIIFVRGINKNMLNQECDINDIIRRANAFGLDAYAYCVLKNFNHPDASNAEQIYDDIYGKFFQAHSGFKGMIFVGESVEFPSKDPHVGALGYGCFFGNGEDNIPDGKPSPGFWPCNDYPQWLNLIKKTIRKYKPDAEIVFWTYNWGYAPEKDRVALIDAIPDDVTILTTYETFQKITVGKAVGEVLDYTISVPTAGDYFISEAAAAKRRNIKFYTMSNTSGKTWDFGVVPYLPVPQQYQKRYDEMLAFHKTYDLAGIMESHHYGLTPSFISRYEKYCFEKGGDFIHDTTDGYLDTVLQEFFDKDAPVVKEGLKFVSDSMNYYTPSDEVQYSAMRIGSAYPLCLNYKMQPPETEPVYFGLIICNSLFTSREYGRCNVYSVRNIGEIARFKKMKALLEKGIRVLEQIEKPIAETQKLINLIKYMRCCVITTIHAIDFYKNKCKMLSSETNRGVIKYAKRIKKIALEEIKNATESLTYLDNDSALGYEPSMGYVGARNRVEWKIKQVKYMLNAELSYYFDSVEHKLKNCKKLSQ